MSASATLATELAALAGWLFANGHDARADVAERAARLVGGIGQPAPTVLPNGTRVYTGAMLEDPAEIARLTSRYAHGRDGCGGGRD